MHTTHCGSQDEQISGGPTFLKGLASGQTKILIPSILIHSGLPPRRDSKIAPPLSSNRLVLIPILDIERGDEIMIPPLAQEPLHLLKDAQYIQIPEALLTDHALHPQHGRPATEVELIRHLAEYVGDAGTSFQGLLLWGLLVKFCGGGGGGGGSRSKAGKKTYINEEPLEVFVHEGVEAFFRHSRIAEIRGFEVVVSSIANPWVWR